MSSLHTLWMLSDGEFSGFGYVRTLAFGDRDDHMETLGFSPSFNFDDSVIPCAQTTAGGDKADYDDTVSPSFPFEDFAWAYAQNTQVNQDFTQTTPFKTYSEKKEEVRKDELYIPKKGTSSNYDLIAKAQRTKHLPSLTRIRCKSPTMRTYKTQFSLLGEEVL